MVWYDGFQSIGVKPVYSQTWGEIDRSTDNTKYHVKLSEENKPKEGADEF